MSRHLQRELERLKRDLLALCEIIEQVVNDAVQSVLQRDVALAKSVIERDDIIDQREVEIEEECLKILALHQPVAIDLRFIIAALKINNDLERIGDLAANIAARAERLCELGDKALPFDLGSLVEKTREMVRKSIDSLVRMDAGLAREVCRADDEIDRLHRDTYVLIRDAIEANPKDTERLILLLSVSRHLERIADQSTNIAEDVIYMIEGEIVRHDYERLQK